MRASLEPITPQDLRDDARNAARLAEILRDEPSKATLLALSRKFLVQAEELEAALQDRPAEASPRMLPVFGTPGYWRNRADEARTVLDQLTAPEARQAMEIVIANYDRLATLADVKEGRGTHEPTRTLEREPGE